MTKHRRAPRWLVLSSIGAMAWTAAGCSSGTPTTEPVSTTTTTSPAATNPAETPIPAPSQVASQTPEVVDLSAPQALPPIVEAVDPAAKPVDLSADPAVEKTAGPTPIVEGAHDGGENRAPILLAPAVDAVNQAKSAIGQGARHATDEVKKGVSQTAGEITRGIVGEVKQTAGKLEQKALDQVQHATSGLVKSIDGKAIDAKKAAQGALDKAKGEILKKIGDTPSVPTP